MLQQRSLVFALLLLPVLGSAQVRKQITLEDLWQNGTFAAKDVPGFNALKDGRNYAQIDGQEINIYSLSTGKKVKRLFENRSGKDVGGIVSYQLSNDERKLLLFTAPEHIYRRSILYKVWVCDLVTGELKPLDTAPVLHATFDPQGSRVAFVKNNNLYLYDIRSSRQTAVTQDGVTNKIINGNCDWVYEEEWEFTRAFEWSPDGNTIAYYRFDESNVKEFTIPFYESSNYPRLYTYKYPKAGESNSVVSIHFYNLNTGNTVKADVGTETDQYIPRIKWTNDPGHLCIFRMNRLQNRLELLNASAATGATTVMYSEENKCYIEINDNLTFLGDGKSFVFTSERDGFNHLYRYNWADHKMMQLTKGAWDVDKIEGIDLNNGYVYYTAGAISPMERKLYQVDLAGKKSKCLTPENGNHAITACNGFRFFLDKYSSFNTVPVYTLIDNQGRKVRVLEDNAALKKTMEQYDLSVVTALQIPNGKGELLNAWMIRPSNFDPSKKYPVLLYQYSGPGSQEALDEFPVGYYFWHQMLAEKGYIVVCADGTGTGGRGEAFKKKTYLQLGKYESDDQIAVGRYMAQQSYVDNKRIGIWGWSYGGFMSATCILKGADVFKTAVAVAPVTNWRYYDNVYTERYMRTPAENEKGYDDNAPAEMAARLQGNFLVIHGTADDNVHFQNAAMLTDQLIAANKQFESEYYPNRNHGIGGGSKTRLQLFRRITNYILQNL